MEPIYQKILDLARPYYERGRVYDLDQIDWMLEKAKRLSGKLNLDDKILLPLIILHDIGYAFVDNRNPDIKDRETKRIHLEEGAKAAKRILEEVGYDEGLTDQIVYLISVHDNWAFGDDQPYKEDPLLAFFNDLDFLYAQSSWQTFRYHGDSMGLSPTQMYDFWLKDEKLTRRPFCCPETSTLFNELMLERKKEIDLSNNPLIIFDRLYGEQKIDEPIVLELIALPEMQRLKGVSQHAFLSHELDFSRFEHSLGVYFLLRRFDAPLAEQLAGLIHDVSHSAFSHCIDYIAEEGGGARQDHQDNIFADFVRNSRIPAILEKYGFKIDYILADGNFPLKESPLPGLCADRLDYSLRLALTSAKKTPAQLTSLLDGLRAESGRWLFANRDLAEEYANLFLDLNRDYYSHALAAVIYARTGAYFRYALAKKYLDWDDLYTTDAEVLEKVRKYNDSDPEAARLFIRMNSKTDFRLDPDDYDAHISLKSRAVDPYFRSGKEIKCLSETDPAWSEKVAAELKPKEYFLKFTC